ncbi:nucleotidyltransferase domain-containing protein [Paenirhodobacter populi]|uniref:Amino acid transporter n=1 Tax=Paenirhodobacter populi TaxID=2306993 RepID=A0A443JRI9_9RHOB|nr:amino acid transporter [Sinirhodobacter populi]RWR23117.1 amino acid transporter [Sinirhodobacter populi]
MQPPPDDAWDPWDPIDLHNRLGGSAGDWYVVGGWALDLWHGAQTRAHEDLEFSAPANQAQHYRTILSDLEFFAVMDGKLSSLAPAASLPADVWQQWGADMDAGCWRVDMMVDRGSPDLWVYKRDPSLTMQRAEAIRTTARGIRYLAPHIVLLFKAKQSREKDHDDFRNALPCLSSREKADLRQWLEILHHGHIWIDALQSG